MESAFQQEVAAEIARVRSLPGDGAPWVVGKRAKGEGDIYLTDAVDVLPSVGPKKKDLLNCAGVLTVSDLLALTPTAGPAVSSLNT